MRVHRDIFGSGGSGGSGENAPPGLTRQDLIAFEHLLKDGIASFLPFRSYSLFFPQSLPADTLRALQADGGRPLHLPAEKTLMLPLILAGQILAVFVAKGVRLPAPKTLPPYLVRLASMCLEQILLYKHSITDPLTGLYTRDYLLRSLAGEIERFQGSILPAPSAAGGPGPGLAGGRDTGGGPLARGLAASLVAAPVPEGGGAVGHSGCCGLILIDLDYFSWVAETYGYGFADRVAAGAAGTIRDLCPSQALVGRLREDTFGIVWPDATPSGCARLAETIRAEIGSRSFDHSLTGERVAVTASLGVGNYPQDLSGAQFTRAPSEQARVFLKKIHKAVSVAKEQGRNRVFPFRRVLEEGGAVLEILPMGRLAVNLGRSVDAQEGQRFVAWSPRARSTAQVTLSDEERILGRYPTVYKGEVVLMEVQAEMAFAEVLNQDDPAWPIEPGDRLTLLPELPQGAEGTEVAGREGFPREFDPAEIPAALRRDILTGLHSYRGFQDYWAEARQACKRFCLVMVRLPDCSRERPPQDHGGSGSAVSHTSPYSTEETIRQVAGLIREELRTRVVGGRHGLNSLVYFLPESAWPDPSGSEPSGSGEVLETWRRIAGRAAEALGTTLVAGIATYPCLAFGRADTLENSKKACDHAALLDHPKVALFDSLSMTISADRQFAHDDIYAAMEEYKLALLADEGNLLARNSLGTCFARLNRLDRARSEFEAVMAADPDNLMAVYNLACVRLKLGERAEARQAFERCLAIAPGHAFSLIRLGRLAEEDGDPARAKACFEEAAAKGGRRRVHRDLARLALGQGRTDEAREHLHQALIANPNDGAALHLLAKLYLDGGEDPAIAEVMARQSVALRPEHREAWHELARALEAQGKTDEAGEAAARAGTI